MRRYQLLILIIVLIIPQLYAQNSKQIKKENLVVATSVSLTSLGSAYNQNFDGLSNSAGSTTNNLTITGWYMTESGGGARDNELYAVDTGASNTGDTYSYGSAGNTDRALGGLRSSSLIPIFGAAFTNNTGSTISKLTIEYTGEEWRLGTAARTDQLKFQYSTNATDLITGSWTDVTNLDFATPFTTTIGSKDGNNSAYRTGVSFTVAGLSIPNGTTFWIRWSDLDASGADDGLAVDDFSLTPKGNDNFPDPPVATAATNVTSTSFRANWNLVDGANKYFLDVATSITFDEGTFLAGYENNNVGDVNLIDINGLTQNTTYHYRVRSENAHGKSLNSNIISVTTTASTPPSSPVATNATLVTWSGFTANWNPSDGATKYYLDVSTSNTFAAGSFLSGYENKDVGLSTSEILTGLDPSTSYYYQVRASNTAGTSGNSNSITVSTPAPPSTDLIVNEWSQGSDSAKEWIEILVVTDHLNMQNYKLVDGNNSLSIAFTGNGFQNVRKGTLIVVYNGGDVDGLITQDLIYNGTTDKNLIISSLNSSGSWGVTRTTGWNGTTGAFTNGSATDLPKIQNPASSEISYSPQSLNSSRDGYYTSNTSSGAVMAANWSTTASSSGTPGLPNGGDNTTWINVTLATEIDSPPDVPIANAATSISTNGFTASWNPSNGATKYYLDIATDNTFSNMLAGYNNRDMGLLTSIDVTGLDPNTQYHYRVRAYNLFGTSLNSNTISVTTQALATVVQFTSFKGKVSEDLGTYDIELGITNPDPSNATSLQVAIISGTGTAADIDNYSTQTITFPANQAASQKLFSISKRATVSSIEKDNVQNLTITLTNDNIFEGPETITFQIQNVSGGNNARIGTNDKYELKIVDPIDPNYYNGINSSLTGSAMKQALHDLIKGHRKYPYTSSLTYDVWDILMDAYEDPANTNNVLLIYTGRSQAKTYNGSTSSTDQNAWNREHLFAQSRGGFNVDNANDNPGVASDAHNLAPEDASVNTDRSNKDFDIGGTPHAEAIGCRFDSDSWEPRDAVKGDIARILFYMDVRYEGDNNEPQLELFDDTNTPVGTIGKLSTLLLWNQMDPPDAVEIARNNSIYTYQGNKNPFIDHPEWVSVIYGSNSAPVISNISRNLKVPEANQNLIVTADIIDNSSVASAFILYRVDNGSEQSVPMTNVGGTTFSGVIPESAYNDGNLLNYRIRALDNDNNERLSSFSKLFTGTVNISQLHQVDANGTSLYERYYAKVQGTATVPAGIFSSTALETVIQDATGGMTIYKVATTGIPFVLNKKYTVIGSLTQYNGLAELVPDNAVTDIIENGQGAVTPTVHNINQLLNYAEPNESKYVKIKNATKIAGNWAGGQTLTISDGRANTLLLHLDSSVGNWGTEPIWPRDILGIFSQFDTSSPYTDNYQIKPRGPNDFLTVPTHYQITVNNQSPIVGTQVDIVAQLLDANNTPVNFEGRTVVWNSTNGGAFSSPTSSTDANGKAIVTFFVSSLANTTHVVTLHDDTEPPAITGTSPTITTVGGNISKYILSVNNTNPEVASEVTISAQLVDQFDNPLLIAGKTVSWSSTNGGSFSSSRSTTNANGIAVITFKVSQTANVAHTILVSDNSTPVPLNGTFSNIITHEGTPSKYVVTSGNYNPIVGSDVNINAQLADQYGNSCAVSGKIVTWTSTWGGNFASETSTTDANGIATVIFTVSQTSNKNHKVTATDNSTPTSLKGTSENIITVPGSAVKYVVTPSTKIPRAGSTITATAQLADQFGNAVSTASRIISWSSTNGASISSPTTILDNNGKSTVSITVSQVSSTTHIVSVIDDGNPVLTGISESIKTIVDYTAKYLITVSNPNPAAGSIITITAQLADQFNNEVSTSGKVLTWTSTNGGIFSTLTSTTNTSGKSSVNFTVSQNANTNHTINVTDNSSPNAFSGLYENLITLGGSASRYLVTVSNSNPVVGSTINVTAQLVDQYNNPVNAAVKQINWSSSNGGSFAQQSSTTNTNGFTSNTFTVSSIAKISHIISVIDNSTPTNISGASNNFITVAGAPSKYLVTSDQYQVIAGNTVKISAQVVDQFENPVEVSGRTVIWSSTNNGYFSSTTNITNEHGLAQVNFTTSRSNNISHIISAEDAGGFKGSTREIITYMLKPEKPALLLPFDNSFRVSVNPTLTWTGIQNCMYKVQVSKSQAFAAIVKEIDDVQDANCTVENLDNKTQYFWRVMAKNEVGNSDYSAAFNFTTIDFISEPSDLDYTFDATYAVGLFWRDNSNNEDGFIVERADAGTDNFVVIGLTNQNILTFKDSGVQQGKKYKYRITAFNTETVSIASNILEITIPTSSVLMPGNFSFTPTGSGNILLSWQYNLLNILGFRLERLTISGLVFGSKDARVQSDTYQFVANLLPDAREFLDQSSREGVLYNYRLTAYNADGFSLPATFAIPIIIFTPPSNLKVSLENQKYAKLIWNDLSIGEEGFNILRSDTRSANYQSIFKTKQNVIQYIDSTVVDGKKYFYQLSAFAGSYGLSILSNRDSILIQMKAPTNLQIEQISAQNKIRLKWKDNSASENGYIIERKLTTETKFTVINRTASNAETFTDESVGNKQNFIYRVKGYNDITESGYSNEGSILVGIEQNEELPKQFMLSQNYPNPFNPSTVINYQIPVYCFVSLKIFDVLGNEIADLINELKQAGYYNYTFNTHGLTLGSGIYFYRLQAGSYLQIKKMLLIK